MEQRISGGRQLRIKNQIHIRNIEPIDLEPRKRAENHHAIIGTTASITVDDDINYVPVRPAGQAKRRWILNTLDMSCAGHQSLGCCGSTRMIGVRRITISSASVGRRRGRRFTSNTLLKTTLVGQVLDDRRRDSRKGQIQRNVVSRSSRPIQNLVDMLISRGIG
jgi:hypothetical protein